MSRAQEILSDVSEKKQRKQVFKQYTVIGNSFSPVGDLTLSDSLLPGIYDIKDTMTGIVFEFHDFSTDELLRFEDSRYNEILEEINQFWELKDDFNKMGFTHKRGILLFGTPGCGKSCLLKLVMEEMVERNDVAFVAKNAHTLVAGLAQFREVEPERKVLVITEDIDEIIRYGEHSILELFDGDSQMDNVLFLATTNYIDRLPPRILRSGRFDRKMEIKNPPPEGRREYLKHKLGMFEEISKIDELVDKTDDFSFAQLREFLVSVYCLKQDEKKVIDRIRNHLEESLGISEQLLDLKLRETFEGLSGRAINILQKMYS